MRIGARPPRPWSWADTALLSVGVLTLAARCVLGSAKRFLWYDEVITWTLTTDPSLPHALGAVSDGTDSAPPLYHVLAWTWMHTIGHTELALRAFSALAFSIALALVWVTLRRRYSVRAAAVGALVAFSMSRVLTYQVTEARFYGLLTALVALAVYLYARVCDAPGDSAGPALPTSPVPEPTPRSLLVAIALTHTALVYTHVYGIVYSGAILCAWLLADRLARRWRPRAYLAIVLAWLTLIPWIPSIRRAAALARPQGWIPSPTPRTLLAVLSASIIWPVVILTIVVLLSALGGASSGSPDRSTPAKSRWQRYGTAAAVLAGAAFLSWLEARIAAPGTSLRAVIARPSGLLMVAAAIAVPVWTVARYHSVRAAGAHEPLLIVALALLCVPLVGYVLSKATTPIFVDRYFLPSTIGVSIIVASATELTIAALGTSDQLPGTGRTLGAVRMAWACLFIALALRPVWSTIREPRPQRPGAALEAVVPPNSVVIVDAMLDFMPLLHYQQRADIEYVHPMDRTVVEDPRAGRGASFGYNYLSVLREHGYLRASSPDSSSPLCTYAGLVVARGLDTLWFALRIAADSTLATAPLTVPGATRDSIVALTVHPLASGTTRACIRGVERPS